MTTPRTIDRRLGEWEGAGLLSHEQAAAIRHFEDDRPLAGSRRFGRVILVVAVFAVLLLAAGAAQIVAANWDGIPDAVKLAILVAAVVGCEIGGWRLRQSGTYPRLGEALLLLGYLLYGSGIHLVAQTYHRPLDDPSLLALWFLPALPFAHLARSGALVIAGVAVGYGALGMRLVDWLDGVAAPLVWASPYLALAALLVASAALREGRLARAYETAGAVTALGVLYVGGFRYRFGGDHSVPGELAVLLSVVSLAALAAVVLLLAAGRSPERLAAAAVATGLLSFAWLWGLDVSVPGVLAYVLTNAALLGVIVWLVVVGLIRRRAALVNAAVVAFALLVFTRYVEIGIGMLGTGLSFLGTGMVLLALAAGLEWLRRRLLAGLREEVAHAA